MLIRAAKIIIPLRKFPPKSNFWSNQQIKTFNLLALYEQYTGWTLRKSGRAWVGKCPFHEDNSPSLAIYTDTNSVYCFSCKFSARGSWFEKRLKEL